MRLKSLWRKLDSQGLIILIVLLGVAWFLIALLGDSYGG